MLVLVPKPIFSGGVIIGETAGIINLDFTYIRSIDEFLDEKTLESTTKITFQNNTIEYILLPFPQVLENLMRTVQINVIDVLRVKTVSYSVNKLLTKLENNDQIK